MSTLNVFIYWYNIKFRTTVFILLHILTKIVILNFLYLQRRFLKRSIYLIFRFGKSYEYIFESPDDGRRFYTNMSKFVPRYWTRTRFLRNIAIYFDVLTFPYIMLLKMSFSCNILWHGMSKYWSSISFTLYNDRSVYLLEQAHFLITNLYTGFYYAIYDEREPVHYPIFHIQKCLSSFMNQLSFLL